MAFGFLLARQVYGQTLHSSEIKAWQELDDFHWGVRHGKVGPELKT